MYTAYMQRDQLYRELVEEIERKHSRELARAMYEQAIPMEKIVEITGLKEEEITGGESE